MNTPGDKQTNATASPAAGPRRPSGRGWAFRLAAFGLTLVSALAGTGLAYHLLQPPPPPDDKKSPLAKDETAGILPGWEKKPDLVLVLTGEMHGYLLPCGCSSPQVGGLERRYNLLQLLKDKGWPYVAVDVGDLPQKHGPLSLPNHQGLLKYEYAMKALERMGYSGVSFGEYEGALPIFSAMGYWLNNPRPPILSANLLDRDKAYDDLVWACKPGEVQGGKSPIKVGVAAVVGPQVGGRSDDPKNPGKINDPSVKFGSTRSALDAVLTHKDMKDTDLRVLLYQGPANASKPGEPPTEAVAAAKAYPQFPVILSLDSDDEPTFKPIEIGNSVVIRGVGHKGKYVGLLGVYLTGNKANPFEFKYQPVVLSEKLLTPKEKEKGHPVLDLMEQYTKKLKDDDYLAKHYGPKNQIRHPIQVVASDQRLKEPEFAGSEACKSCHDHAYGIWKKSAHSHAYQTLVDATRPGNRQYDPECIVCHTVGFSYKSGFVTATATPNLRDVGCESCHGPASEHIAAERARDKNRAVWYPILNPWKAPENETAVQKAAREGRIDAFCQKCHDSDNDVTWTHKGFERKWPLVDHTNK